MKFIISPFIWEPSVSWSVIIRTEPYLSFLNDSYDERSICDKSSFLFYFIFDFGLISLVCLLPLTNYYYSDSFYYFSDFSDYFSEFS